MVRRASPPALSEPRKSCLDCGRPERFCLCSTVTRVANRTEIVIVQHPRERQHAFGTVRLAELSLDNLRVVVDRNRQLRTGESLLEELEGAGLLYPHPDAADLAQIPAAKHPSKLVVIDGTWHHARTLYRDIPELSRLPHYTLPSGLQSGFRIRRQPQAHCLSTLEAIYHALKALEPNTPNLDHLLDPFEALQRQQLSLMSGAGRSKSPSRSPNSRGIPRALVEDFDHLVVGYGECDRWDAPGQRKLLSWAAERPATGERFFAVLKRPPITEEHRRYLRLRPEELVGSVDDAEFRTAWQSFSKPGDRLATWNQSSRALLARQLEQPVPGLVLKSAYHRLRMPGGSLEDVVMRERLPALSSNAPTNRSIERLDNALRLTRFLRQLAQRKADAPEWATESSQ